MTGADGFLWMIGQEGFDPTDDSIAGFDADGEVQADAGVWHHRSDAGSRVFIWAEASPGFESLRPFLIGWAEHQARRRLASTPTGVPRIIRASVEEHRTGLREAFVAAGFPAVRSFAVMRRGLTDLPAIGPPPDGIEIVTWSEDLDDAMRDANNEAFADHWGSLPMSAAAWRGMTAASDQFRPEASFAACEGDRVVAFCTVEWDPEDAATRGFTEFYLHKVGTRRAHRRRGLASLLVTRALHAAAAAGADTLALEVDESSFTDATRVYAHLGFAVVERTMHHVKEI